MLASIARTEQMMEIPEKEEKFRNKSHLKERGWTEAMIRQLLGEPDREAVNPYHRSGPMICLYRMTRVEEIEATDAWKERRQAAETRRHRGKKIAGRKRAELLREVENEPPPTVPKIPLPTLIADACDHYNLLQEMRGHCENRAHPNSDEDFLRRIATNYLRHHLTNYEHRLRNLFGKVDRDDAYEIIRAKVMNAIYEAYPELRDGNSRPSPAWHAKAPAAVFANAIDGPKIT